MHEILAVRQMLTNAKDLRAPMRLEEQLRDNENLEGEVGLAMMQMLKARPYT